MNFNLSKDKINALFIDIGKAIIFTPVISLLYMLILIQSANASEISKSCQNYFIIDYLFCSINDIFSSETIQSTPNGSNKYHVNSNHFIQNRYTRIRCSDVSYFEPRHIIHRRRLKHKRNINISSSNEYSTNINYKSQVCVRSGPGTEYEIINTYRYIADYLTIYSREDGWQLIGIPEDGTLGWIKNYTLPEKIDTIRSPTDHSLGQEKSASRQGFYKKISKTVSFVDKNDEKIALNEEKEFSEQNYLNTSTKDPYLSKLEEKYYEEEFTPEQNTNNNTSNINILSFSSSIPYNFDVNLGIGPRNINLPYFIAHSSDQNFPYIQYQVWHDDIIFNNKNFPRIDEESYMSSTGSTITMSNSPKEFIPENKIYNLESGIANFDKFIITDDGHIHVSAGISDQFNIDITDGEDNMQNYNPKDRAQSWAYMPLILVHHANKEDQTSSGFYRIRNIQRSGIYSNCTHTVTDGLKGNSTNTSEFIVGNAEICFDNTGRKARISYGYELWVRLSSTNSNSCLSINLDRNLCRVRDSRLKPLISFWTSTN